MLREGVLKPKLIRQITAEIVSALKELREY
jgi:hypothetical protein